MSYSRHKHRHFQYALDLIPSTLPYLNNEIKLNEFDEVWVKTFFTRQNTEKIDPFWVSLTHCDFL